jgi:hypothetical protein
VHPFIDHLEGNVGELLNSSDQESAQAWVVQRDPDDQPLEEAMAVMAASLKGLPPATLAGRLTESLYMNLSDHIPSLRPASELP